MAISTGRVAENRRARFDYQIDDTLEAGLILKGSEVKSLRTGRASIAEAYATEEKGRLVLVNANIPVYPASRDNHEPKRIRELLVSRKQRDKLLGMIRREGMTLVPMALYFNDRGRAKIQLGMAKGRKNMISGKCRKTETGHARKTVLLRRG